MYLLAARRRATQLLCAWGVIALLQGCIQEEPDLGVRAPHIVGGEPAPNQDAVARVIVAGDPCSGSLIAPAIVITAAHCLERAIALESTEGDVAFGPGGVGEPDDFTEQIEVRDVLIHRRYTDGLFNEFDIGFVRLKTKASVTPIRFNTDPLPDALLGTPILSVGYGVTDGETREGFGTKRQIVHPIRAIFSGLIVAGGEGETTCFGDSGGAHIVEMDNEGVPTPTLVAVTSFGAAKCKGPSYHARVDRYADLVNEVVSAWGESSCKHDGQCCEVAGTCPEGCEFADPDCDACGLDGVCTQGCPKKDLDCDRAGFAGELCDNNEECESLLCIPSRDDDRVKFCSQTCDPDIADPGSDCEGPLTVCQKGDDQSVCQFSLAQLAPSVQGAECTEPENCRSKICDTKDSICVEPCNGPDAVCPEGFVCRQGEIDTYACRLPDTGGCSVDRKKDRDGAGLVAVLLALANLRLRRCR